MASHAKHSDELQHRLALLEDLHLFESREEGASLPFERIGDFRLVSRIGQGGMGEVFLAEQLSLRRLVALKLLRAAPLEAKQSTERFRREARAIGRLHHPGIVGIHGAGEERGVLYLAMEYVPGRNLSAFLSAPGDRAHTNAAMDIAVSQIVRWGRDLARALHAVHEADIVHRDVKPSNIRITPDDRAVLLDFGLVRDLEAETLSRTGAFLGSPHYAAPEQITADRGGLGPATDVYALGVVLYELVTGERPYGGDTTEQVLHQVLTREPRPPRKITSRVPPELETVLLKAMEKDAAQRYASARALGDDLQAILELRPIAARRPGLVSRTRKALRRNRSLVAAASISAILVISLACLAGYWGWHRLTLPERVSSLHRQARLALLDPMHESRVWDLWSEAPGDLPLPFDLGQGAESALAAYDELVALAPGRSDIRLERDVVALARARSSSSPRPRPSSTLTAACPVTARAWAAFATGERPDVAIVEQATETDRRALGLLAYLIGDVELSTRAWSALDLRPEPDPLVDAASGQLLRELGRHALAYPRLVRAFDTFGDAGFLAYAIADSACQIGDVEAATHYLELAETLPLPDPWSRHLCVRADVHAARGELDRARAGYERARHLAPSARRHYARMLEDTGRAEDLGTAVDLHVELLSLEGPSEEALASVAELATRWWQRLGTDARAEHVAAALGAAGRPPRLVALRAALAADQATTRARDTPFGPRSIVGTVLEAGTWHQPPLSLLGAGRAALARAAVRADAVPAVRSTSASADLMRATIRPLAHALAWLLALAAPGLAHDEFWVMRRPDARAPAARFAHAFSHDSARGVTVLFGGCASSAGPWFDDTWEWDGSAWTCAAAPVSPPARSYAAAAYDARRGVTVLFGGLGEGVLGDTWLWDGVTWTACRPDDSPSPRANHAMAYDVRRERVVLFGGRADRRDLGDTWEWDGSDWEQLVVPDAPVPRSLHGMAYDTSRSVTVLFGGAQEAGTFDTLADLWEWDGTSWSRRTAAPMSPAPHPRCRHAMTDAPSLGGVVMLGGNGVLGTDLSEWWVWDGSLWSAEHAPAPGTRHFARIAYDTRRRRLLQFGGSRIDEPLGDTWVFGAWSWGP